MKIVMIRHGMTEGNYKRRYIGATDEPLADTKALMRDYPMCDIVVSSPMKRCIQTANFIYPKARIQICEKLRECDFGDFENKSYEDLKDDPRYAEWIKSGGKITPPDGEPHELFRKRCVEGFFESLCGVHSSAAFVVHGGTIMAVMSHLRGGGFYDYMTENGGMRCFDLDEETIIRAALNK